MKKNKKYNIKNDNIQDFDNFGFFRRVLINNLLVKLFFFYGLFFVCFICFRYVLFVLFVSFFILF